MAITVKHLKVSAIPDSGDDTLIEPSDWNADHTLVGTIPVENGGTGAATLTGYVKGNGTSAMTASSTIPNTDITGLGTASTKDAGSANGVATLDAGGKVPVSELPAAVLGALSYQGTWNASTNTPTLTSSVGTKGYYYVVNVAGSTNLDGITDWLVGDWAVYNGTAWQKVDNTETVTSVNGQTGAVVLTTTNIAEGTNEYFTTARARTSISAGTGISYDNSTGVITNSSPSLGGDVVGPASATDNAIARFDTTTGKLIQNSVVTIDDTGNESGLLSQQFSNGSTVTLAAGKQWYDGATGSWNLGMGGGNITQQVGEELFIYGKASTAISDNPLQIIYQTGTVGSSGVVTFAPTVAGITNGDKILGVATENLALNAFGRITAWGLVHGITTNGTAFGETWADGDEVWYNPVTGNPTNVKPVAPNIKVLVGVVVKAGAGGSGTFSVEINHGSVLGGTDSNVQLTSVTNGNILTYGGTSGYWKNTDLTAGTGISVSKSTDGVLTVTNTSPSSGGTVTSIIAGTGLTGGTITSSGTIAIDSTVATLTGSQTLTNKTISGASNTLTNIGNSSLTNSAITINGTATSLGGSINVGTVTSVTGTAPVVSSGGATPAISMAAANGSTNGYLTSTDWTTFNSKAAAFTYTSNYIPYGQGTTTPNQSSSLTFDGTIQLAPIQGASNGIVVNNRTIGTSYSIPSGYSATSAGPITISSGVTVTVPTGGKWVVL